MIKPKSRLTVSTFLLILIIFTAGVGGYALLLPSASPTAQAEDGGDNDGGDYGKYAAITSTVVTSTDGVRLYVEETGNPKGEPVILIHGILQSRLAWDGQFSDPALRAKYRLVRFDLRGHGASDKPTVQSAYSAQLYADDVESVVKLVAAQTGGKKPALVGWSLGGFIESYYLHYYGQSEISALAYIDTAPSPIDANGNSVGSLDLLTQVPAIFSPVSDSSIFVSSTKAFVNLLTYKPLSADEFYKTLGYNLDVPAVIRANVLASIFAAVPVVNGNAEFAQITLPILIVHGKQDDVIPVPSAYYMKSLQPKAELVLYDNVGHYPLVEVTGEFNRTLAKFLAKVF